MRKKKLKKHVGVLFTEETYNKVVEITDAKEIPLSQYIREIVEEKINQSEEGRIE
jgi:predicted DNA-binding protein